LTFNLHFVDAQDYGENSTSLGQFVDEYENENYVSVKDNVVRNSTYDAMMLNESTQLIRIKEYENGTRKACFQFREHRIWGSTQVLSPQAVYPNDFRTGNTGTGYRIAQWFYITVNREWLDGKYVRFNWYKWGMGFSGGSSYTYPRFRVYDGEYNRSSFDDFPLSANPVSKGSGGLMQEIWQIGNVNIWYVRDILIDTSSGNQTYCTLMWADFDYKTTLRFGILMDYIQINTGAGGAGNVWTCDFEDTDHNLSFELSGTYDDYGLINGTIGYYEGGYCDEGSFNTTNYMSEVNGSGLVVLLNSSIPAQSEMTIAFSTDGENFTDHNGVSGYDEMVDGLQAFDIRNIYPDSELEMRFNLSKATQVNISPRLYQTRLITTQGSAGAAVTTENYSMIVIGLMIGLLFGIAIILNRD